VATEWIKAASALSYVGSFGDEYRSKLTICQRAHSGLIKARAETLIWNGESHRLKIIPKEFWWAEGHEALEQDWYSGNLSTWIDQKIEVKAFGVSFDFIALSDLVPAERQAGAMRAFSVMANPDWISAAELHALVFSKARSLLAGAEIIEACRLGKLAGRAMHCIGTIRVAQSSIEWAALEWDIPLWFWRDFIQPKGSSFDWQLGKLRAKGQRHGNAEQFDLAGIHFHRPGLLNLGLDATNDPSTYPEQAKRGRRPEYNWSEAISAIWGQLHRGDLQPNVQADIERALIAHLTVGDKEPSESTVRPFASNIWQEFNKP
jgi:hypothetical protein